MEGNIAAALFDLAIAGLVGWWIVRGYKKERRKREGR